MFSETGTSFEYSKQLLTEDQLEKVQFDDTSRRIFRTRGGSRNNQTF